MIRLATMRKLAQPIANKFNVVIRFCDLGRDFGAQATAEDGLVEVNTNRSYQWTRDRFLSYLMHEVVHCLAWREGKFRAYHSSKWPEDMTDEELKRYIATAWRAERWVEERARKLLLDLYPGSTYWFGYGKNGMNKEWFDKSEVDPHRKELRRRRLRRIDKAVKAAA